MAIHTISSWKSALDDTPAWTASTFLLGSLQGYQGPIGNGRFADREQTYNFLMAWRLTCNAVSFPMCVMALPIPS
jgi:hypothetical protein